MPSKAKKFMVELGRVILVTRGPLIGKIAVIVDVIDQNRALVDGPGSGVKRQPMSFKDFRLTKFVLKGIQHGVRTSFVKKVWEENGINQKWAATSKAQRLDAVKKRENLTDLDRFRLYKIKQRVNRAVKASTRRISKTEKKSRPVVQKLVKKPKTALNKKKKAKRLAKKASKA